jgi:hypothetical protein
MTIRQYLESLNTRYKSGISREHSYRGDLESLIRELVKGVTITNEPANVTDCGNPDYVITNKKIPIGYIEAKDIGNKVYINDTQYFDNVPLVAWEFYIGGYQPAQKWLKDRKGRELSYEDIKHYQKIIVALTETDRIMKEIDKVGVE